MSRLRIERLLAEHRENERRIARFEANLARDHIRVTSAGGAVDVVVTGSGEVLDVEFGPDVPHGISADRLAGVLTDVLNTAYAAPARMRARFHAGLTVDGVARRDRGKDGTP